MEVLPNYDVRGSITQMKKLALFSFLMCLGSTAAFADIRNPECNYRMPEPAGIAELATCSVGLGMFILRRRKTSV